MKWVVVTGLAAAALVGGSSLAAGQTSAPPADPSVRMTAPVPAPPPAIRLEPTMPPEATAIREQQWYPGLIYGQHEPAFVIPWVTTVDTSPTSSVRVGFSAWTAPSLPFDSTQGAGGPALGLTILWGGPAVPRDRPAERR
jgi:hypothetical protein